MPISRCARAVEWLEGDTWECRNCGGPLATDRNGQLSEPVRHRGELRRALTPAKADAAAFGRAVDVGEHAANALPEISSREEIARAVVEELYRAGLLRRTPAKITAA
ncbi:hypothetical protein [Nonomuraea sp. NPDC003214]